VQRTATNEYYRRMLVLLQHLFIWVRILFPNICFPETFNAQNIYFREKTFNFWLLCNRRCLLLSQFSSVTEIFMVCSAGCCICHYTYQGKMFFKHKTAPVPFLGQSSLPISIIELCRKLCHREPVTHLEVINTEAIRLPFNFSVIKFLPKLPKTLKFGRHTLQLWQMIPNKIL